MKTFNLLALIIAITVMSGCAATAKKETETKPAPDSSSAAAETRPTSETSPEPVALSGDTYTVVRGDHLWGISSKPRIYGNPYQWPLLYKANSDVIEDADLIEPGQVLKIDRNASGAEIDAAVRHARTRGAWSLGVVEESDKAYLSRY